MVIQALSKFILSPSPTLFQIKKWLNEYDNLSPTPKNIVKNSNIIEFRRKLINLHVSLNL